MSYLIFLLEDICEIGYVCMWNMHTTLLIGDVKQESVERFSSDVIISGRGRADRGYIYIWRERT